MVHQQRCKLVWRLVRLEFEQSPQNRRPPDRISIASLLCPPHLEPEKVVPLCGFVRRFIALHPDYADLLRPNL